MWNDFYIFCFSGTFDIFVGGKKYGVYKDSGSFGELALMYNQPRAATIIATTEGSAWAMVGWVFSQWSLFSSGFLAEV